MVCSSQTTGDDTGTKWSAEILWCDSKASLCVRRRRRRRCRLKDFIGNRVSLGWAVVWFEMNSAHKYTSDTKHAVCFWATKDGALSLPFFSRVHGDIFRGVRATGGGDMSRCRVPPKCRRCAIYIYLYIIHAVCICAHVFIHACSKCGLLVVCGGGGRDFMCNDLWVVPDCSRGVFSVLVIMALALSFEGEACAGDDGGVQGIDVQCAVRVKRGCFA